MRQNYQYIYDTVAVYEGGFVDHPRDPGGATNKGIIQRTYDAYRTRQGLETRTVRLITDEEVQAIYRNQYWNTIRGDELPSGLDLAIYDFGVNSGPSRAVRFLQEILGVAADGIIGDITLGAIARKGNQIEELVVALCEKRMAFLKQLSTFGDFGRGWTRRVMGETMGVQVSDTGVIDRGVKLARGQVVELPTAACPGKALDADMKAVAKVTKEIKQRGKSLATTTVGSAGGGYALAKAETTVTTVTGLIAGSQPIQYAMIAAGLMIVGTICFVVLKKTRVIA
ncbi:MAG: glycoside hydrolase family 108 protein [Pseudomonadota bacterium]